MATIIRQCVSAILKMHGLGFFTLLVFIAVGVSADRFAPHHTFIDNYPYIVEILSNTTEHAHIGVGVLISPEWVLSALNTFEGDQLFIRYGSSEINRGDPIGIKRRIFDPDTEAVELFELVEPVNLEFTKPVNISEVRPEPGESVTVVGWLVDTDFKPVYHTLQAVHIPVVKNLKCVGHYLNQNEFSSDLTFCVQVREKEKSCSLETGAAVLTDRELSGLVLFPNDCYDMKWPNFMLNIVHYRKWILETIAQ